MHTCAYKVDVAFATVLGARVRIISVPDVADFNVHHLCRKKVSNAGRNFCPNTNIIIAWAEKTRKSLPKRK